MCLFGVLIISASSPFLSFSTLFAEDRIEFNRDIRPIFSDTCFACHGPDEAKAKGKLRLDSLVAAQRGGKSGEPAIVPGHPEKSAVMERLLTKDEDDRMPPADFHKVLSASQIETVRRWIQQGAEYQGHWAFQTPRKPAVPMIPKNGNEIDGFLTSTLAAKGLTPNGEADRATLLRRASLDLIGLPPSDNDLNAFLKDESAEAWSNALDRLLASPHYGETMAMQWLDFARYADSNGFQSDTTRTMWPWRDWVIKAFNTNMPFDRFTIEQLAGDLLPNATEDQIVATGFHRNVRLNGEAGRIVEEWFAESVIDRVETTGSTWMALTMNCCRCHDHKYDPITQKEFYQFFAYFNSIDESGVLGDFGGAGTTRRGGNTPPTLSLADPDLKKKIAEAKADLAVAEVALKQATQPAPQEQMAWETKLRENVTPYPVWSILPIDFAESRGHATLTQQSDGSWLAGDNNPPNDTYVVGAPLTTSVLTGLLLEVFPDVSLPQESLGRNADGNFVLSDIEAIVTQPDGKKVTLEIVKAEADFEQKDWAISHLTEGHTPKIKGAKSKKGQGWAIAGNEPNNRVPRKALFTLVPVNVASGSTLTISLYHEALPFHNIGRFRLSASGLASDLLTLKRQPVTDELRTLLTKESATLTELDRARLAILFQDSQEHPRQKFVVQVNAAKAALKAVQSSALDVMVMKELDKPRDAFVLLRGEYDKIGPKVERKLPSILPPLADGEPNNRLGFARWLVSGQHPLTGRVWVNRTWEHFFGTGLVKTSENFGSQAEWPSHPELLDWLAVEFVDRNWDMKGMQKLIMMSAAYRRSAAVTAAMQEKDPENRFHARGPRFRLSAETIRDQALALSGLLVPKVGGPSVRPYMPEAVWDETSVYGDMRNYKADTGEGLYRRSLYTIWKRTAAPPSMVMFDSATREVCTVKRSRSNTPLQALSLLNEVTYVEAARKLAERTLRQPGDNTARLQWAVQQVTRRSGKAQEIQVLLRGLEERLVSFAADKATAEKLLKSGTSPVPTDLKAEALAAWSVTANILLNLDETITRE
jgi:hypothetical protein